MADAARMTIHDLLSEPVLVVPDEHVRRLGRRAPGVPAFDDVALPGVPDTKLAARMLDLAEEALRYNHAPDPILRLERRQAGSNGPIGRDKLVLSTKGCRECRSGLEVKWPKLVAALVSRRAEQPAVANVQDLAEAYHLTDYYSRVYGSVGGCARCAARPPRRHGLRARRDAAPTLRLGPGNRRVGATSEAAEGRVEPRVGSRRAAVD